VKGIQRLAHPDGRFAYLGVTREYQNAASIITLAARLVERLDGVTTQQLMRGAEQDVRERLRAALQDFDAEYTGEVRP
jgi:hypothetical protein